MRIFGIVPLLLLAAVVLATTAHADGDDPPPTEMPSVIGDNAERARERLEGMGLIVERVTIAGPTPGLVERQDPTAGTLLGRGARVVLHVTIRTTVETLVPDLVGLLEADAVAAATDAYVVDIAYVEGDAEKAGTVVAQSPAAGSRHLLRAVVEIQVVRRPLLVPRLLEKTEGEAREILDGLGLILDVRYLPASTAPDGQVVSQDPASGAEIVAGGVVRVQVSGDGPRTDPTRVAVPDLVGRAWVDAQDLVFELGLIPHQRFVTTTAVPHLTVVSQDDPPGTMLDPGQQTKFVVALSPILPGTQRLPSLVGMDRTFAASVADRLGLRLRVEELESPLRAGRVLSQDPAPGTTVTTRTIIGLVVSRSTTATRSVRIPDVVGLSSASARAVLLASGLRVSTRLRLVPNKPVSRVAEQFPPAGELVEPSTRVILTFPHRTRMPDLIGQNRAGAIELLRLAGLDANARGPSVGIGRTEVVRQSVEAGQQIAKGTTVRFDYRFTGIVPTGVVVPDVVGLDVTTAQNRVLAAGLGVSVRGPAGRGSAWIVAQSIDPGTRVRAGTIVGLEYRFGVSPPLGWVTVPSLNALTVREARHRLTAAGLLLGVRSGSSHRTVASQNPRAGARVPAGTRVDVTTLPAPALGRVRVPDVVGTSAADAQVALARTGLRSECSGPAAAPDTVVTSQHPVPGTVVARNTCVRLSYAAAGGPAAVVVVPDVEGLSRRHAVERLEAVGFRVRVVGVDLRIGGVRSTVQDQDPEAGTLLARGSRVTIELGL